MRRYAAQIAVLKQKVLKQKLPPKIVLILTPKKQFFKQNILVHPFQITNCLAKLKKIIPRKIIILTKEPILHPLERSDFLSEDFIYFIYLKKLPKKRISDNTRENNFSNKKTLAMKNLPEKLVSNTCSEKIKCFISDSF